LYLPERQSDILGILQKKQYQFDSRFLEQWVLTILRAFILLALILDMKNHPAIPDAMQIAVSGAIEEIDPLRTQLIHKTRAYIPYYV
jgi:hypothetical protein